MLHKRITDLLVEIEGESKPEFAGLVIANIKEDPAKNFSMEGIPASADLFGLPE